MSTMSVVCRGTNSVAVDLAAGASARIIERAVRTRAGIRLELPVDIWTEPLAGHLAEARGTVLAATLKSIPRGPVLQSACCDGTIFLDGEEYLFASFILGVGRDAADNWIEIARPEGLQTWQRRRFVRAAIADSARVFFSEPNDYQRPLFDGAMLNISPDGMACRVNLGDADRYAIDESVGTCFALTPGREPIALNAVVRTKTPAGSPGMVIVGLQFVTTSNTEPIRARLAEALRTNV